MKIIPFETQLAEDWDRVAANSDDAWAFHASDWLLVTEAHWPLESKSFLIEHEGRMVGIFPLQLNRRSHSLWSTYMGMGGPALINGLQEGVREKVLKSMHEHVRRAAVMHKSPFIELLLSPLSEAALGNQWQVNPLVNYGYEDVSTHSWLIDLAQPDETIFRNFSDDARASIKKAMDMGYTISRVTSIKQMDDFYSVHCENRKRTGVAPHPKGFFRDFYERICAKNLAIIWQAKAPDGHPAAFEVTGIFKKGAFYWMGCCSNGHLDNGVNYLLQDHSIRWARAQGAAWYENGEAFPNVSEGKRHGLSLFKGKFGGRLHRFFRGRITFDNPGPLRRMAGLLTRGLSAK